MSKGKFKFSGVQKQKGRPTIVNGIEGQRYVVNKYLENLVSQQSGRTDDYRVYTPPTSDYQEYDDFTDESLNNQQQEGDPGSYDQGQQGWSGQQSSIPPQVQAELSDEQKWSQPAYEQQMSGQHPAMQEQQHWDQTDAEQGYADQQMSGQQSAIQKRPWGQHRVTNDQPWGQPQAYSDHQLISGQQAAVTDQPWGQSETYSDQQQVSGQQQMSAQQQVFGQQQMSGQQQVSGQQPAMQDQPWGQPVAQQQNQQQQFVTQPQSQPFSQPPQQDQVQSREQQSTSHAMLRSLFSGDQSQNQSNQSAAVAIPSQQMNHESQQQQQLHQLQEESKAQQRYSQEMQWTSQQQSAQQQPQQAGRQKAIDPQEQQQWVSVAQPQAPEQQIQQPTADAAEQPRRREQAPKTMMFEKPKPRTGEMARVRRTQDGFEVTKTQQAMKKLDAQFFAAEEALNATFPMPNAKGMKRQQEKKNKNVVKSVRGTVEFLVHANGRTFTPTYNKVGVLIAVEVSDGFVLTRGERGDSSWTMTDKDGNSVEEDPITGVAFDKKGNLWYETEDGRRTTFNVDGTTKTAMKE